MDKFAMFIIKVGSKIHKLLTYNQAINDLICKNKQKKTIKKNY